MKHLQEYIFENIVNITDIFESYFKSEEFIHGSNGVEDYHYALAVIDNILSGKNIDLGDKKTDPHTIISVVNLNKLETQLKKLKEQIENFVKNPNNSTKPTSSDFNKIFNSASFEIKSGTAHKNADLKNNLWKYIYKGTYSGIDITTREQEAATCLLFNSLITNNKFNLDKPESFLTDENIISFVSPISSRFQESTAWIRSFRHQIIALIKLLKDEGISNEDIRNFRMNRYGGDDGTKVDNTIAIKYANVIQNYTKQFPGSQKDNWDPSDVLLYNEKQESEIKGILDEAQNNISTIKTDDNQITDNNIFKLGKDKNGQNGFNSLYSKKILFGISLKQLSHSGRIEKYNLTFDTDIHVNDIIEQAEHKFYHESSGKNGEEGRTVNIYFKGKIIFNDDDKKIVDKIINPDNIEGSIKKEEIETDVLKKYKVSLRTFGKSIGIDVSECKGNSNSSGPSLGKCSTQVWTKLIGSTSTNATNINNVKKEFINFINNYNKVQLKEIVKTIAESAIKCGPHCLPFILIH